MAVDAELFGDALPTYLTRFVGRERECRALLDALAEQPQVTVCGVGGAGKTRLTVEVAKQVRDGEGLGEPVEVCWVSLAEVLDAVQVGPALATALGLTGTSTDRLAGALTSVLRNRRVLVVLDNCEHVAQACRELVAQLLAACPGLLVVATSRIPLGLEGEALWAIPPLGSDASAGDGFASDASALFVDRASIVAPAYALTERNGQAVLDICRLLHGSPLAIELAASWIRVLSPDDLLAHLGRATAVLQTGSTLVEERHRSMQAVLDSSWQWLRPSERAVLAAMGVFVGGCTREAAEAVADADLSDLARLSELALVQRLPDAHGRSRYQVHELVRVYALERLDEPERVRDRHLEHFLALVESLAPTWDTPRTPLWDDPVNADVPNIDAAGGWAFERKDAQRAQRLAVGLNSFYLSGAVSFEHRRQRLEASLALPGPLVTPIEVRSRAQATYQLGLRLFTSDLGRAHDCFRTARRLYAAVGDDAGVAACVRGHGNARILEGDPVGARRDTLLSLEQTRACGDVLGEAWCHETIGAAALDSGDWAEAVERLATGVEMFTARADWCGACCCEIERGIAYSLGGQWPEAVDACSRALELEHAYRLGGNWAEVVEVVARLCAELRRPETAAQLYGALTAWHSEQDRVSWWPLATRFGRAEDVRRRLGEPAWHAAHDEGRQLGLDRATALVHAVLTDLRAELEVCAPGLSTRETEVLRLVAAGLTDAEIAAQLVLSPRTVHAHLRSVYRKLDVTTRTAAVRAAGIVSLGAPNA